MGDAGRERPSTPTNDAADAADPTFDADATDADLLEELTNNISATNHEQHRSGEDHSHAPQECNAPLPPPTLPTHAMQPDADGSAAVPPLVVDRFPHGHPGAPVPGAQRGRTSDWEIAHWAKMCVPSSSAMEELLAIPDVKEKLGLSFSSVKELNHIINNVLQGRPTFECHKLTIGGETLELHFRNILSCIRSICGDPDLAQDLVTTPEHHYSNHERTNRIYSEMHTGDWWWAVQTTLESHRPGATVVPIIISSDKTQLTLFCHKSAYPVYLTIGNVLKAIHSKPTCHTQLLLAYIPTTKLEGIANKTSRHHTLCNLYHSCMQVILDLIATVGKNGITMMSGDGIWRRCHPILASFVGDYLEQVLGHPLDFLFAITTKPGMRQKPVFHPLWKSLPLVNIFVSTTPDILHQLLQGVLKHLIMWLIVTFGPMEIDVRCQALPPNHHIMIFMKGISGLSCITGKEHKNMCRILLSLVTDLPVPDGQVSP
ncbi:hypothetical protein EI94DRAFT_1802602 [Lactarius quietus]|nr:hypothetical protein EI94DRAFT_1802602 [Lactarius quietus]